MKAWSNQHKKLKGIFGFHENKNTRSCAIFLYACKFKCVCYHFAIGIILLMVMMMLNQIQKYLHFITSWTETFKEKTNLNPPGIYHMKQITNHQDCLLSNFKDFFFCWNWTSHFFGICGSGFNNSPNEPAASWC